MKTVEIGLRLIGILFLIYLLVVALVFFRQRSLLYFPSHGKGATSLAPWNIEGRFLGYCRVVAKPRAIWLMLHGNGGQASDRDYVLPRLSDQDSLYVVEYPGYGERAGSPSLDSINDAAREAYRRLRQQNPGTPVGVLGESLGTGPACVLAQEKTAPDKIVLAVPFDVLGKVAAGHFPYLPARLLLRDAWDNVASLQSYAGPVEIYGAEDDMIIPIAHARALAAAVPRSKFTAIAGGHNGWAQDPRVKIEL